MVKDMLLQILDGNNLKEYRLENFNKEYITFGRNSEQDIVLKNINVLRQHGYIKRIGNEWYIFDNKSTKGIWLNEKMISSSILKNGDVVFLNREKSEATKFTIINDNMIPVIDRGQNNRSINRYFRMITD